MLLIGAPILMATATPVAIHESILRRTPKALPIAMAEPVAQPLADLSLAHHHTAFAKRDAEPSRTLKKRHTQKKRMQKKRHAKKRSQITNKQTMLFERSACNDESDSSTTSNVSDLTNTSGKQVSQSASSSTSAAASTSTSTSSVSGTTYSGGEATYFYQGGNPGSCGNYAQDSDLVVAVQQTRMNSSLCGKKVLITNTATGATVTATVADTCPSCQGNPNSLDLSVGAFEALGSLSSGVLPISYVLES
ncbi:hypothetical protein E5Q_02696 [Mixia osmundae IAM 14324]|uniref:RlpA-like protein double-psi beta-barrel domain-containing protein n=2 Tax=Mixia osmundae (strain CBS 9802 / IAM 14324 / JCM 22182 / KY 12970) TaxID=764103 RepID=G7DZM6_MIXOS|nr:hypothetical protein E5Q_02696 [Mixia osmundae IAM 14324]